MTPSELHNLYLQVNKQPMNNNLVELDLDAFNALYNAYKSCEDKWNSAMEAVLNSDECIPFANLTIKSIRKVIEQ